MAYRHILSNRLDNEKGAEESLSLLKFLFLSDVLKNVVKSKYEI